MGRRRKVQKKNLKRLLLAALLSPALAQGLSLGDAVVQSYLMEPLLAEVPVTASTPDELAELRLRLGAQREFDRFGITRLPLHGELRFELQQRDGAWLIQIRSRSPVREPYLSFPLEAVWRGGQLLREYTVLLDPRVVPRPAAGGSSGAGRAAAAGPTAPAAGSYGPVRPGETLWPIAQRLKPAGVSTEQMMMALLRANPAAFVGNNVNRLQAGAQLRVPDLAEIRAQGSTQARTAFRAQTEAWRGGPPGSPAAVPAPPEAAAEEASELRILERESGGVEPLGEPVPADDAERRLLLALERAEAQRLETEALQLQIDQLQAQLAQMRQLLELKEAQVSALQAAAAVSTDAPAVPPAPETAAAAAPVEAIPPAMVRIPDRNPVQPASDGLGGWWVWLGVLGSLVAALLAVLLWRRTAPTDLPLARHPDVRVDVSPYADAVARLGAQRREPAARGNAAAATASVPADVATEPLELDDLEQALGRAGMPQAAPAGLPDRPLGDLAGSLAPIRAAAEAVSDDEIESWVRDLADESDLVGWNHGDARELVGSLDGNHDPAGVQLSPDRGFADTASDSLGIDHWRDERLDDGTEPDPAMLRLELAQAYLEIGDPEAAREILTQVVDDSLAGPEQQEAQRLLNSLR